MTTDLTDETDIGLLLLIGGATDTPADQSLARDALRELHTRHYGYVLGVLERYAENRGTLAIDPKEWASKTFAKAFRSAATFSDRSNGDFSTATAQVKAWLGRMAQNAARDELKRLYKEQQRLPVSVLEDFHETSIAAPDPEDYDNTNPVSRTPPELLSKVREVLESLKPAELEIVRAYTDFGVETPAGRELPKDVREALELSTGYERCTIRQKWRRLSQRLKSGLDPHFSTRKPSTLHA